MNKVSYYIIEEKESDLDNWNKISPIYHESEERLASNALLSYKKNTPSHVKHRLLKITKELIAN